MAAPTIRGVGSVGAGAGAVSPGLPTGTAAGDLLLMFIETSNQSITASGWTQLDSQLNSSGLGPTGITVLYRTATGSDATTTSDSGDHQLARIIGIETGTWDTADPFGAVAKETATASTSQSIPGGTTDVDDALVVAAIGTALPDSNGTTNFSGWGSGHALTFTEQIDNTTNAGNGGGLGVATAPQTTAGAFAAIAVTLFSGSTTAEMSFSVNPAAAPTDLTIQDATHAHTADNVALTQVHSLVVQEASHGHTTDVVALAQTHILAVQDALHAHTADQVTLEAAASLTIQNASHGHSAENLSLTQTHQLAVQDASHAQVADQPLLTQVHSLAINNAAHGHTASNLELTQNHVLEIQAATHSHSAENVSLGLSGSLGIHDATHGHTAEQVTLSTQAELTIHDATHSHTTENIDLAVFATLQIQSALHSHTAESLQLAQLHALAVADASHAHTAANVVLLMGDVGVPVDGPTKVAIVNPRNQAVVLRGNNAAVSGSTSDATVSGGNNSAEVIVG